MFPRARNYVRVREQNNTKSASREDASPAAKESGGQTRAFAMAPFQRLRWGAALLIVVVSAGFILFCLASGSRPACQVTTVSSMNHTVTTKICGSPDMTSYLCLLAVVALLLLPDAASIKVGGFEFQRLTGEVKQQANALDRIGLQVSQLGLHASQVTYSPQMVTVVTELAREAVKGDTPPASRKVNDALPEFLDPGPV
jgi:hypothetical protein